MKRRLFLITFFALVQHYVVLNFLMMQSTNRQTSIIK